MTGGHRLGRHGTGSTPAETGAAAARCLAFSRSVGDQSGYLMGQISNCYKPVTATVLSQQMTVISRSYGVNRPKPTLRLYDGPWMSG